MTGGIAEAYWGIPTDLRERASAFMDETMIDIAEAFEKRYGRKILPAENAES